jgi:glycosyltransferase involved in cell wall biosynthesis
MKISVTVLTKNSERCLAEVLKALADFDEVVVYDTGSTDRTLSIAREYPNVVLHEGYFDGFGPTHNRASSLAHNDWILSIDSDEVATKELVKEIKALQPSPGTVYTVWRQNYFNGKWIRWCGWYPDRQVKLYNRTQTAFSEAQVHEAVITTGLQVVDLEHPVKHYPYPDIASFLAKMQQYSTLYAQQAKGKPSSVWKAVGHGSFAFFKSYFLKRGFLGGREGFIISAYNAHTALYKYLKLLEANDTLAPSHEECDPK